MKNIQTLVDDLYQVIQGQGGWTESISTQMGNAVADTANKRFSKPQEPRGYLSLSSIGTPCKRKLWYKVNKAGEGEQLESNTLLKFFYGDMIEELILSMTVAAGHDLKGSQDRLDVHGIKGHRDAVIDGMTVDVKSCSSYAFRKFKEGNLRDDDPGLGNHAGFHLGARRRLARGPRGVVDDRRRSGRLPCLCAVRRESL